MCKTEEVHNKTEVHSGVIQHRLWEDEEQTRQEPDKFPFFSVTKEKHILPPSVSDQSGSEYVVHRCITQGGRWLMIQDTEDKIHTPKWKGV